MTLAVSRAGLHVLLWRESGPTNTVRVDQTALAEELTVTPSRMSKILARMIEEGRLLPLSGRSTVTRTYIVVDPVRWALDHSTG